MKTKTLSIFDVDTKLLNNFIHNLINTQLKLVDIYTTKDVMLNHNNITNNKEFLFGDNKNIIRFNSTYFVRSKSNLDNQLIIEIRINRDYKKLKFFDNRMFEVLAFLILNLNEETMQLIVSESTILNQKNITYSKRLLTIETLQLLTILYQQSKIPYSNEQWKKITTTNSQQPKK